MILSTSPGSIRRSMCMPATVFVLTIAGYAAAPPGSAPPATRGETDKTDEPVQLAVFEVGAQKDVGYAASTAMLGTRTNEKLENLPNSISIMTQEFIEDMAFNNYLDAIDFSVSAENTYNAQGTVGAVSGNQSGNEVNFRGLASIRQLRDGFPMYIVADAFNTERLEFGRGPGGLAYGDVDAGGTVNIASKRATFQRKGSVQARLDSFGTKRFSLDVNEAVVPGRLGVRFNAINSETRVSRQRAGRDLEGYAGSLRWEPFKNRRTQIDAMVERGNTTNHVAPLQYTDARVAYVKGTGTTALDAGPNRPGVQLNGVGMRQAAPVGNSHALVDIGGVIYNLNATATDVFRVSATIETNAAISATDPQNPNRYALITIPTSIVPLGQDWGGPDNVHDAKYHSYTVELKHSVSDRLNLLVAHNGQKDDTMRRQGLANYGTATFTGSRQINIDVNPVLPNPNGAGTIPNPNFEELYIFHRPTTNFDGHEIQNWRGQAVYDAQVPWGVSQRVVLGVTYRHEKYYVEDFAFGLAPEEIGRRGFTGAAALFTNNLVAPVHYFKDGNGNAALGWNPRPGQTQLFRANALEVNRHLDQSLTSGWVNILGSYFKNRIRTSIGLSRDHWRQSASAPTRASPTTGEQQFVARDGTLIPNQGTEKGSPPLYPFADEWSTNQTYGAVWHALPWISLTAGYFESSQFSDNYGLDLNGGALAPRNGEGTDYSVRLHLLGGKIEASVTRFATQQENQTASVSAAVRDELNPLLNRPFVNTTDYRDRTSTGWEYQILTNITPNWTLIGSYSRNRNILTRFFPITESKLSEARSNAQTQGRNPDDATVLTRQYLEDQEESATALTRSTAALTTRYMFRVGRFKGLTAGVSARYAAGRVRSGSVTVAGLVVRPSDTTEDYVLTNPFIAYRRKFSRFTSTLQLNVNNIFDVRSEQGSLRFPRYTEPRQFVYTATISY
ncbi:MAG: TonB-dependent receptor plug domain-containing protein [Opitutaceae bacterium]|nr:TonB-dependent receptor plug domain-containing protein [Opitutaceae bacterium]